MIAVEQTRDWRYANRVMFLPEVKEGVMDDNHAKMHLDLEPFISQKSNLSLLVKKDGERVGLFLLRRVAHRVYEIHTMLTEACRGKDAIEAGKKVCDWMFRNTQCQKITSYVPGNAPHVYVFARRCGFRSVGMADLKWVKGGTEYPVRLVELDRKDWTPCQ